MPVSHRSHEHSRDAASDNAATAVVLRYAAGDVETVLAIRLGPHRLLIDGNLDPSQEVDVGLTVEVEAENEGAFKVRRVVTPSPYVHWTCSIPEHAFESMEFADLC